MVPLTPETVLADVPVVATEVEGGAKFLGELVDVLNTPGSTAEQVGGLLADLIGALAVVVGSFDHSLGLSISTVPQATIAAAGALLLLGVNVFRLHTKTQVKGIAAGMVAAHLSAPKAVVVAAEPLKAVIAPRPPIGSPAPI